MRILAIGDNCIDHYVELGKRFPGGNALNVAVYAGLHQGVESDYVGVVGTDENGRYLLSQIEATGMSTKHIIVEDGVTAVTKIRIIDGDRVFDEYIEGVQAGACLPFEKIPDPRSYDLFHFTVWGFGREHVKKLKESTNAALSCDFSNQIDDPRTSIMPYLDISFFSGRHLITEGVYPEQVLRKLKRKTRGMVVMTLGEYGSMVYDGERLYRGKALPVDVVDTLGAGDAYIAAFLCSRMKGDSIMDAVSAGHIAAREVCKRLGAWGGED